MFGHLNEKNNGPARALGILVHFLAVRGQTTTWNDQIQGFVEYVSTWRWIFHSLSQLDRRSHLFCYWIVWPHCTSWTNWNNREAVQVARNYVWKWRFRWRCRRLFFLGNFWPGDMKETWSPFYIVRREVPKWWICNCEWTPTINFQVKSWSCEKILNTRTKSSWWMIFC